MIVLPEIKIEVLDITSVIKERSIDGKTSIQGIAKATVGDDDGEFTFLFDYMGKHREDKSRLINYLKARAATLYSVEQENNIPVTNTLEALIDNYSTWRG